jgi:arylsulfatase
VACAQLVRTGPAVPRSVVFLLVDTLRRDRIGAYGGPDQTPHFDAFAADGFRFDRAHTQAPWTKPAIATLFTGLYPSQHGVVSHPQLPSRRGAREKAVADALPEGVQTLAESLGAAGYRTAAFVSNPWIGRDFGFAQGFEHWNHGFARNDTPGEQVIDAALVWLRSRRDDASPFFLYLHTMDPHAPYHPIPGAALEARRAAIEADERPVPPEAEALIARMARDPAGRPWARQGVPANLALLELLYDQGVAHFDSTLGRLLAGLDAIDPEREIAVVVTSDHGEALLDRGYWEHGDGLQEDELGLPLAARLPGLRAVEDGPITCATGLVDLRASLCDYLGVPCAADHGRSWLGSDAEPRYLVAEGVKNRPEHRAIFGPSLKLVYEPGGRPGQAGPPGERGESSPYRLYDLARDPAEQRDLLESAPTPGVEAAFDRLRDALPESVEPWSGASAEPAPLDDATRARLEALGYLGEKPGAPEETTPDEAAADDAD